MDSLSNTHSQTFTLRDEFLERLSRFEEAYDWHEQDESLRSLTVTGDMLELMFGPIEAALGMAALLAVVKRSAVGRWSWAKLDATPLDLQWPETWSNLDGWAHASQPRFFDELHDLNAFARYGILPVWERAGRDYLTEPEGDMLRERMDDSRDVPVWVESVCAQIDRLEQLAPRGAATPMSDIKWTRDLARARLKYDRGESLTVPELAMLSGTTIKRLQNAIYAKADEAPVVDRHGLIGVQSAKAWLNAREYLPSIWKEVVAHWPLTEDWGTEEPYVTIEPMEQVDDFVFVPVAKDGTVFRPGLRRDGRGEGAGGYTVGPKGSEVVISGYDEALEALGKMVSPKWRRPNENGHWGIVVGQAWMRFRRTELEGL